MKIRLALIVCLIMVMTAAAGFAATTLTTIYPQKSLTVGDKAPTNNNTVEVVDGSVNVSGTDTSVTPNIPACYKIGGTQALVNLGTSNWLIGNAGNSTMTGTNNTFVGYNSGAPATSGAYNTCIGGYVTGQSVSSGSLNTFVGYQAGGAIKTGSNNVMLGDWAGAGLAGYSNTLIIEGSGSGSTALIYGNFSTGHVTINAVGDQGYAFYVSGNAWTNGTWGGSDIRWKNNIETLANPIDKILKLRGVKFDWRREEFKDKNFPEGKQIGVIAQEVEKEFPELVSTSADGYKGVGYDRLSAVLLEAIKAQQKEIRDLKSENAAQINALRQEIEKLKK